MERYEANLRTLEGRRIEKITAELSGEAEATEPA